MRIVRRFRETGVFEVPGNEIIWILKGVLRMQYFFFANIQDKSTHSSGAISRKHSERVFDMNGDHTLNFALIPMPKAPGPT